MQCLLNSECRASDIQITLMLGSFISVEGMCHSAVSCLLTKEIRPIRLTVSESTCSCTVIPLGSTNLMG